MNFTGLRMTKYWDLEELNLDSTLVTENGLDHLKGLTRLRRLTLNNTPLATGLTLKESLPELEIIR